MTTIECKFFTNTSDKIDPELLSFCKEIAVTKQVSYYEITNDNEYTVGR